MIVITLSHPQQLDYLKHLFEAYLASGQMTPDQLPLAADTFVQVSSAREIPTDLGKAKVTEMSPNGLTLEFEGNSTEEPS